MLSQLYIGDIKSTSMCIHTYVNTHTYICMYIRARTKTYIHTWVCESILWYKLMTRLMKQYISMLDLTAFYLHIWSKNPLAEINYVTGCVELQIKGMWILPHIPPSSFWFDNYRNEIKFSLVQFFVKITVANYLIILKLQFNTSITHVCASKQIWIHIQRERERVDWGK